MKNKNTENTIKAIDKHFFYLLVAIYLFIITGAVITFVSPLWLKTISSEGRKNEAITYVNYGDYFLNSGSYNKAVVQYKKAIEIDSDIQEAYVNISIAYNKLNDLKIALQYSKKALKYEDKPLYATYFNIADIYKKNKQNKAAIKYYLKAAKVANFPIRAYHQAGELLNNSNNWDAAKQAFDKAINNKYTIKNCYYGMLNRDIKLFEQEDAKQEIRKQIEVGIDNLDLQEYDKLAFDKALNNDGELAGIYNQYGFAFAMQGNMTKAVEYFELSLKRKSTFEDAKKNLRLAKSKLRNY